MAETFDTWESYFYPETYDPAIRAGTLKNKFGERDPVALAKLERDAARFRAQQIRSGAVDVPRTFDAAHIRALHGWVFQDAYEWAGQFRTVNTRKRSCTYAGVDGEIDYCLTEMHIAIVGTPWASLDRDGFVRNSARLYDHYNYAHPFREGSSRIGLLFMEEVSELSRFGFEWERVRPWELHVASDTSVLAHAGSEPDRRWLASVFGDVTVERSAAPSHTGEKRGSELLDLSLTAVDRRARPVSHAARAFRVGERALASHRARAARRSAGRPARGASR